MDQKRPVDFYLTGTRTQVLATEDEFALFHDSLDDNT